MKNIVDQLAGGDRRSLGCANMVVKEILRDPKLFSLVFEAMLHDDPVVRMRAADAIEKVTVSRPELLQAHKRKLLGKVAAQEQQEVRWHVALMVPRLRLTPKERNQAVAILFDYLEDKSSIVKTFAMQSLADFVRQDRVLSARVVPILTHLTDTGTPAMCRRGRKLLKVLGAEADRDD
jgi:hypothetical protein